MPPGSLLAAVIEQCIGPAVFHDVPGKILVRDLAQETEDLDQVRLAGAIATDEHVQPLQDQALIPDRFEVLYDYACERLHWHSIWQQRRPARNANLCATTRGAPSATSGAAGSSPAHCRKA